jgi:hypothetical protein
MTMSKMASRTTTTTTAAMTPELLEPFLANVQNEDFLYDLLLGSYYKIGNTKHICAALVTK